MLGRLEILENFRWRFPCAKAMVFDASHAFAQTAVGVGHAGTIAHGSLASAEYPEQHISRMAIPDYLELSSGSGTFPQSRLASSCS